MSYQVNIRHNDRDTKPYKEQKSIDDLHIHFAKSAKTACPTFHPFKKNWLTCKTNFMIDLMAKMAMSSPAMTAYRDIK